MASERKRVLFTFGNHMHWVDMQWLWGYGVLPGSVRDMLHLCREAGVKGNINFDGIGYEKMAAECPEALAELREAVKQGLIEPVGCSYGQPYGLFHGGESNIRQFTFGVRSVLRLLGVRPRAFWEEEFYFFPQLPQILRGCGFECANLYFQWTWHTPEVPREPHALILWEGIDGTRIPTLPRNGLNLHQWPEDFELLGGKGSRDHGIEGSWHRGIRRGIEASRAERAAGSDGAALLRNLPLPAIVQWLELMPSKDWMCRSELLLPKLKELLAHPEYEIVPGTMSEVVAALLPSPTGRGAGGEGDSPTIPIRAYTMDDVWHGMTLGKNCDRHPRTSRSIERTILAAESLSATAGLFGRPYASWDVYPSWELDEAWRELLSAQHHDNHECEGLCGFVGYHQMHKAGRLASDVLHRTRFLLQERVGSAVVDNQTGVPLTMFVDNFQTGEWKAATIPPFGLVSADAFEPVIDRAEVRQEEGDWIIERPGGIRVAIDAVTGMAREIKGSDSFGVEMTPPRKRVGGEVIAWPPAGSVAAARHGGGVVAVFPPGTQSPDEHTSFIRYALAPECDALDIVITHAVHRIDPGLGAALRLTFTFDFQVDSIRADSPFAAHSLVGSASVRRKYPEADWMTSRQWFEEVSGSLVAQSFIDLLAPDGGGVLICHAGSQQWFRTQRGVEVVLCANDPWDQGRVEMRSQFVFRVMPHGPMRDADRVKHVKMFGGESRRWAMRDQWLDPSPGPVAVGGGGKPEPGTIPRAFAPFDLSNAPNVIAHAFFRMCEKDGEHLPLWAGHRMMRESGGACTHPFVVRLVEWDGEPADVILKFPGEIAMCAKTNLMGEVEGEGIEGSRHQGIAPGNDTCWLTPEPAEPPEWARGIEWPMGGDGARAPLTWSQVRFTMRPREIATIMADLVMGRKQFRDLDAKREVWATVHRTGAWSAAPESVA